MRYYAVELTENIIGFIDDEEQQAFLVECDPAHKFYMFEWVSDDNPPQPTDIEIKDGAVIIK